MANQQGMDPIEAAAEKAFEARSRCRWTDLYASERALEILNLRYAITAYHEAGGTVAVPRETLAALKKAHDEMPPLYCNEPDKYGRLLDAVGAMIAPAEKG